MSPMLGFIRPILGLVLDLFRSRAMLQAEVLALRRQIIVLRRRRAGRPPFSAADRWVLGWICQLFPRARDALAIVRPEMVLRRHRAGFRSYWRWRSKRWPGRPMAALRGWTLRGQRLPTKVLHGRWKTMTFLAALRHDRIEAPCVFEGPIDGESFRAHVEQCSRPRFAPVISWSWTISAVTKKKPYGSSSAAREQSCSFCQNTRPI